jgi:TIR domain
VQQQEQRLTLAAPVHSKIHVLNCNLSGVTGQIFISHDPAEAAAYVDGLSRYLTAAGLMPWYEREIGGDQRWAQVVDQIRECAAVVVVMTPGAERSPWVSSEVTFAKDLGKPILPLLLGGTVFAGLAQVPHENVTTGAMPSAAFLTRLRSFVPPGQFAVAPPTPIGVTVPPPPPARSRVVIGIVAAAVVGVLALVCVGGAFIVRSQTANRAPKTWQEKAAAIPGIHNYLLSNPDWFTVGP